MIIVLLLSFATILTSCLSASDISGNAYVITNTNIRMNDYVGVQTLGP